MTTTSAVLDPRAMPEQSRHMIAEAVRTSYDIHLPPLPDWNARPCLRHAPDMAASCMACGVLPRRHQRVGITWLFLTPRAGLFDSTGLGKTIQVAGLLSLLLGTGEIGQFAQHSRKALIIARAATIGQWKAQLHRMLPQLVVTCVTGDARARRRALAGDWEVALCGPEMMVSKASNAIEQLAEHDFGTVICDDISALSNVNKTSTTIRRLTDRADRVVVATATPTDKRLQQLYDTGRVLGWPSVLGTPEEFQHRYVNMQQVWYTPKLKPVRCKFCKAVMVADHQAKMWVEAKSKATGPCFAKPDSPHFPLSRQQPGPKFTWVEKGVNTDNLPEFRARIAPLHLRRTADECDDVTMPAVELQHVPLVLPKEQRERYAELRKGALTRISADGTPVTMTEEKALFMRARQITSSLACLDGGKGESVKLDYVTAQLTGDLAAEPVVVYCYFRPTLDDLANRLAKEGVQSVRIWGKQHAADQGNAIGLFNAGTVNVMLITDAGGMGLNLQRARRMIIVDPPLSAGRLSQIIGRIKRDGSAHQACYIQLLLSDAPVDIALAATLESELGMFHDVLDAEGSDEEIPWPAGSYLKAVTG